MIETISDIVDYPIDMDLVKAELRIDGNYDDAYLIQLIKSATSRAENYTHKFFAEREIIEVHSCIYSGLKLLGTPFRELLEIKIDNVVSPIENFIIDKKVGHSEIITGIKSINKINSIKIKYNCGYYPEEIPAEVIDALLYIISDRYENRENPVRNLPTAADKILNRHRLWVV